MAAPGGEEVRGPAGGGAARGLGSGAGGWRRRRRGRGDDGGGGPVEGAEAGPDGDAPQCREEELHEGGARGGGRGGAVERGVRERVHPLGLQGERVSSLGDRLHRLPRELIFSA